MRRSAAIIVAQIFLLATFAAFLLYGASVRGRWALGTGSRLEIDSNLWHIRTQVDCTTREEDLEFHAICLLALKPVNGLLSVVTPRYCRLADAFDSGRALEGLDVLPQMQGKTHGRYDAYRIHEAMCSMLKETKSHSTVAAVFYLSALVLGMSAVSLVIFQIAIKQSIKPIGLLAPAAWFLSLSGAISGVLFQSTVLRRPFSTLFDRTFPMPSLKEELKRPIIENGGKAQSIRYGASFVGIVGTVSGLTALTILFYLLIRPSQRRRKPQEGRDGSVGKVRREIAPLLPKNSSSPRTPESPKTQDDNLTEQEHSIKTSFWSYMPETERIPAPREPYDDIALKPR